MALGGPQKYPKGLLSGEAVRCELMDGVFLCALPKGGGRAVGTCLDPSEINAETLSRYVTQIKDALREKRPQWKIVGRSTLVRWCEDYLRHAGETVAKAIPREDRAEVMFFPLEGRLLVTKGTAATASIVEKKRTKPIRVLIIDDSATIHVLLKKMLASDPAIEVVGALQDPRLAEEAIARLQPNVITLDIHMPHIDGVTLLKRYTARHPIPTIMISALSHEDGSHVLEALEHGAFDYIRKPSMAEVDKIQALLLERIHAAAGANIGLPAGQKPEGVLREESGIDLGCIIGIGSSTGGTEALRKILTRLPEKVPPILIVQHIPPVFSRAFANRMDTLCRFRVKEAEDGDAVVPGMALIAPGGMQMQIQPVSGGKYRVRVADAPPVNRHKPSVDVLFDSMAEHVGSSALGVILTGMGNDGAQGLLKMKKRGARTIGQDQATSVVYGMPREAAAIGAVDEALALGDIAPRLLQLASRSTKKAS